MSSLEAVLVMRRERARSQVNARVLAISAAHDGRNYSYANICYKGASDKKCQVQGCVPAVS